MPAPVKVLKVAFQGEPGAYSEAATYDAFGHIVSVDGFCEEARTPTMSPSTPPPSPVAGEPSPRKQSAAEAAAAHETQCSAEQVKVTTKGYASFEEVFNAVGVTKEVDYAVIPIENTLGGSIHVNYDLLLQYHDKVSVLGEYNHRVRHNLLALPGVKTEEITHAVSHPQALAQTEGFLKRCGIKPNPVYDTAGAAKMVAEKKERNIAAVASVRAADAYGLCILDHGIEDDHNNFTRFLILGRVSTETPEGMPSKSTVVFVPRKNEAGVLFKALSVFAVRDIDLSKVESRPFKPTSLNRLIRLIPGNTSETDMSPSAKKESPTTTSPVCVGDENPLPNKVVHASPSFEYAFYIDALAAASDPRFINAMRHLEELARFVAVLGSYPSEFKFLPPPDHTTTGRNAATESVPNPMLAVQSNSKLAIPLRIAVLGFGTFGQFIARRFVRQGHRVFATNFNRNYSEAAASIGVTYLHHDKLDELLEREPKIDVVVIAVSILAFESVVQKINPALLEGKLVVDVLSVKVHPKDVLLQCTTPATDLLCLHPMFGPESGAHSWQNLALVYDQVRITDYHRAARFLSLFEVEGCRMVAMRCEEHDQQAAGSQFVTHLTGRLLAKLGLSPSPIATTGFKALLKLVDNTQADSFDLFYALYTHNERSGKQLSCFSSALSDLVGDLTAMDQQHGVTPRTTPRGTRAITHNNSSSSSGVEGGFQGVTISERVASMPTSKTVAMAGITADLQRQGIDIVNLGVGEPDYLPPTEVMDAAHEALNEGKVRYTENPGMHKLRTAICSYLKNSKGLEYTPGQVVVSNGAKQSMLQSVLALCGPGDEVIIPAPYWVSYPAMVQLSGAKPVVVKTTPDNGFILTATQLRGVITPATKAVILCNPSNPSGAVIPEAELREIAKEVAKHPKLIVIADEIYEQMIYDTAHVCFATLPDMWERTVTVNGVSKGTAMTGFRIGYACAPEVIASAMNKVQSQNTSGPGSVSQCAAIAAVDGRVPQTYFTDAISKMRVKRDYTIDRLTKMPFVSPDIHVPQGAFYVFVPISATFGRTSNTGSNFKVSDSDTLCQFLLKEFHVTLVPGDAFGDDNCLRISYATSTELLASAMDRLENGLKALQ